MRKFKRRPKRYGESGSKTCCFCGALATGKTESGLEVCRHHINQKMEEIKCTCGSWLEQRPGKFGAYFNCINCGNVNFAKAMQIKAITSKKQEKKTVQTKSYSHLKRVQERISTSGKQEITIRSDDPMYFD